MDLSGPLQAFYEARNLCDCPLDITFTSFDEQLRSEQRLGVGPLTSPEELDIDSETLICIPGLDFIKGNYPKARLQSGSIYTEDRRIYTSAGMTTGIDLALYLLESWYGAFVAARVAQELVVPFRREGGTSQEHLYNQMQGGFHPAVFKAQEILLNQPEANPSQEQLAAQVHLSPRHLAGLFKKSTRARPSTSSGRRCGWSWHSSCFDRGSIP